MSTVFNLRLPSDLKRKIEIEAKENHTSINQYLLYLISKTVAYNEAMKNINTRFTKVKTENWKKEFSKIPDVEPFEYDQ
jgi:hypothetical protein